MYSTVCLILSNLVLIVEQSEVLKPRGVSLTESSLYIPSDTFTCFDGSKTIPYYYVNDDYCDCFDSSDEPGTSACPHGKFYCLNAGHRPKYIPSSRVNDGVCDCCDTSDEYNSTANCVNNCRELGHAAREKAVRDAQIMQEGLVKRREYSEFGIKDMQEKKKALEELLEKKKAADEIRDEKENFKRMAEEPEREALDHYRKLEEEKRKMIEEEERQRNEEEARTAFVSLDTDNDGRLHFKELQAASYLDQNADGQVTEEEAKFFLSNNEDSSVEDFISGSWALIKPLLTKALEKPQPEEPIEDNGHHELTVEHEDFPEEVAKSEEQDKETEEEIDEDDDEDEDEKDEDSSPTISEESPVQEEIKYDDKTQQLIDAANQAREDFEQADKAVRDLQQEIKEIQDYLDMDLGESGEFVPLKGKCFEHTDREYTYKLCLFNSVSQKPKSGGEVNLGRWGTWAGSDESKHSAMMYDHGTTCWNGPTRTTKVKLQCGSEDLILSVSEPNMCEYEMEFQTPAVCSKPVPSPDHFHEEL